MMGSKEIGKLYNRQYVVTTSKIIVILISLRIIHLKKPVKQKPTYKQTDNCTQNLWKVKLEGLIWNYVNQDEQNLWQKIVFALLCWKADNNMKVIVLRFDLMLETKRVHDIANPLISAEFYSFHMAIDYIIFTFSSLLFKPLIRIRNYLLYFIFTPNSIRIANIDRYA